MLNLWFWFVLGGSHNNQDEHKHLKYVALSVMNILDPLILCICIGLIMLRIKIKRKLFCYWSFFAGGHVQKYDEMEQRRKSLFLYRRSPSSDPVFNELSVGFQHVPELEGLEERLVVVVMANISVYLIIYVLKKVASIAPIISFLPLANRVQRHQHLHWHLIMSINRSISQSTLLHRVFQQ